MSIIMTNKTNKQPTIKMKIVDCFIFYNELDMLYYRLSLLYNVVDYFVICEASRTHMGKPKPFYFWENAGRFEKFLDKIILVQMTDENTEWYMNPKVECNEQWKNENIHRNGIDRGIQQLSLEKDDWILICDLDEIPNPDILSNIRSNPSQLQIHPPYLPSRIQGAFNLCMDFYYYNLTCIHATDKWCRAKILMFDTYIQTTPQKVREIHYTNTILMGGWHLSYFGNAEFIKNKIENFTHQEYNKENYTNIEIINKRIQNKEDIYGRMFDKWRNIDMEKNPFLPPKIEDSPFPFNL